MSISKERSETSNTSGGWPRAWMTRGRRTNGPSSGFQPRPLHTCHGWGERRIQLKTERQRKRARKGAHASSVLMWVCCLLLSDHVPLKIESNRGKNKTEVTFYCKPNGSLRKTDSVFPMITELAEDRGMPRMGISLPREISQQWKIVKVSNAERKTRVFSGLC